MREIHEETEINTFDFQTDRMFGIKELELFPIISARLIITSNCLFEAGSQIGRYIDMGDLSYVDTCIKLPEQFISLFAIITMAIMSH